MLFSDLITERLIQGFCFSLKVNKVLKELNLNVKWNFLIHDCSVFIEEPNMGKVKYAWIIMCNLKPNLSLNVVLWHLIIRANVFAFPLANCIRRTNRDFSPSMQEMFLLRGAKIGLCLGFVCWVSLVFFFFVVVGWFQVHFITLSCPINNFKYNNNSFKYLVTNSDHFCSSVAWNLGLSLYRCKCATVLSFSLYLC